MFKLNDLKVIDVALWGKRTTSYNAYLKTLYIRGYEGTNKEVPYSEWLALFPEDSKYTGFYS